MGFRHNGISTRGLQKAAVLSVLVLVASSPHLSPAATTGGPAFNHPKISTASANATELVFEVSGDGSRTYTTIQDALADATDASARKVIRVYPGTYTLESEQQIEVTVDNTHIIGMSRDSVAVHGNVQLGPLTGATINIKADDCSVENLTLTNTAKVTDAENFKATALMVYIGSDGFRGKNLKLYSYTAPTVNRGWGYDCFWCHVDTTDCRLQGCEIFAYSDIVSVGGELTITDSVINVMVPTGGYPFWVGSGAGYGRAYLTAVNVETRGAKWPFGYLVFGENGNADARLINVTETDQVATPPDYYIASTNAASTLLLSNTFGQLPRNPKSVSTSYLKHDIGELPSGIPATKIANGTVTDAEFQSLNGITGPVQSQLNAKAVVGHNHDDRYYTRLETDFALKTKQAATQALTRLSEGVDGIVVSLSDDGGSVISRAIQGTGNNITVTNGNGIDGNPVIDIGHNIPRYNAPGLWTQDQGFHGNIAVGTELYTHGIRVEEREVTAGSHVLLDTDYIIWLNPTAGDVLLQLPPDRINERRGKVFKFVVVTNGTGSIAVRSPYGTPFRVGSTIIPGGADLTIPATAGTEITLVKAQNEWRGITN